MESMPQEQFDVFRELTVEGHQIEYLRYFAHEFDA
jgi:hypothetical protein